LCNAIISSFIQKSTIGGQVMNLIDSFRFKNSILTLLIVLKMMKEEQKK
jgi:hypothetical protein